MPQSPAHTLSTVSLTPGAVAIAVGDTLQLSAEFLSVLGTPMPPDAVPVYTTDDSTIVSISQMGLIKAVGPKTGTVTVRVRMAYQGVTKSASILVTVVAARYEIDAIKFGPVMNATVQGFVFYQLAFLNRGLPVPAVAVKLEPIDTGTSVLIYSGYVQPKRAGIVRVRASVNAFGRELVDTLVLEVKVPAGSMFIFSEDFNDRTRIYNTNDGITLLLQRGGTINLENWSPQTFTITFTDPDGIKESHYLESYIGSKVHMVLTPGLHHWETTSKPVLRGKILVE